MRSISWYLISAGGNLYSDQWRRNRSRQVTLIYRLTDFHINWDSWEGLRMRLGWLLGGIHLGS